MSFPYLKKEEKPPLVTGQKRKTFSSSDKESEAKTTKHLKAPNPNAQYYARTPEEREHIKKL